MLHKFTFDYDWTVPLKYLRSCPLGLSNLQIQSFDIKHRLIFLLGHLARNERYPRKADTRENLELVTD